MALDTVADYISEARVLLQDTVQPYRYPDADIVSALNMALPETAKARPDLFIGQTSFQTLTISDTSVAVAMDPMYRSAVLYYILGHIQLRDDENVTDQRSEAFFNMARAKLLSLSS
jgi:hypothetical protein